MDFDMMAFGMMRIGMAAFGPWHNDIMA